MQETGTNIHNTNTNQEAVRARSIIKAARNLGIGDDLAKAVRHLENFISNLSIMGVFLDQVPALFTHADIVGAKQDARLREIAPLAERLDPGLKTFLNFVDNPSSADREPLLTAYRAIISEVVTRTASNLNELK